MSGSLEILDAGPGVTVQDLGRPGLQRFGVPEGGALDRWSHHAAAALLANDAELAAIELLLSGARLRVAGDPVQLAVTGHAGSFTIDGRRAPVGQVIDAPAGAVIDLRPSTAGAIAYLAIGGGVDTDPVLGSRSTHLRARLGGLHGTALRRGDVLEIGDGHRVQAGRALGSGPPTSEPFRVVWALHASEFEAPESALDQAFTMTASRDRMGAVLEPERSITAQAGLTLPSAPVVAGDLQVPGDGRPVALLADRQPTGGYPRLATIVGADLDRFAQVPVGEQVRFEVVDLEEAVALHRAHRGALASLPDTVDPPGASLWGRNLISGITVGDEESR